VPAAPASGATLSAEAEDRLDAGDAEAARDRLLAAAVAHRAAGALDAALDACYLALGLAPADPELHLALAELYLDRGWRGPAADKLLLLGRLVDFTRDGTIRERVCELVATRLPDDPRLTALCA
jgi:thioredoxin-like negative regulator of GroEL